MHAKPGLESAAIPHESTVRVQFMPNRPTALTSSRFTCRFGFVCKVQTRCLRTEHEDAHFCLALARNCKTAVVEAKHLADEAQRPHAIKVAHGDDKCKIPQGQPGEYVSATTRDHAGGGARGSLLSEETIAGAMDHDHYNVQEWLADTERAADGCHPRGCR